MSNNNNASQTPFTFRFVNENEQFNDSPEPGASQLSSPPSQTVENDEYSTLVYDVQSQWVLFELFKERYLRLETSSNSASKDRLYEEIRSLYNSNPNINGKRNLRSLKNKWNDMLRTFRRRKDQQSATGTPPLTAWPFHEEMELLTSEVATVVPPTVFSSFMENGETEDNRPERPARRTRIGQGAGSFSIEDVYGVMNAHYERMDAHYERTRPERELIQRYLSASMNFMESLTSTREQMLENMIQSRETFERVSTALENRINNIRQRPTPSPPSHPSPPFRPSNPPQNEPSRANKRRRMSH